MRFVREYLVLGKTQVCPEQRFTFCIRRKREKLNDEGPDMHKGKIKLKEFIFKYLMKLLSKISSSTDVLFMYIVGYKYILAVIFKSFIKHFSDGGHCA